MILCRVQGQAVASVKDPHLNNNKLLVRRPVELDGESPAGREFLALDRVKAGPGDLVLCVYEGSSARGFNNLRPHVHGNGAFGGSTGWLSPRQASLSWPARYKTCVAFLSRLRSSEASSVS